MLSDTASSSLVLTFICVCSGRVQFGGTNVCEYMSGCCQGQLHIDATVITEKKAILRKSHISDLIKELYNYTFIGFLNLITPLPKYGTYVHR